MNKMLTELLLSNQDWKLFKAVDDNGEKFYAAVHHYDETDGSFPHWRTFFNRNEAYEFFSKISQQKLS